MLEGISGSLLAFWLNIARLNFFARPPLDLQPLQASSWQNLAVFRLPPRGRNLAVENSLENYQQTLAQKGINSNEQGVWIQSDWSAWGNSQGKVPVPAASLTKIATTLAALAEWGADYRFTTQVYARGKLERGILAGDLIVEASGDPFFVWEEAIALGNALNQLGIRQVEGNLIVSEQFYMNYESDALTAGKLLKQALNRELWTAEVSQQYAELPANTPRPQIAIAGQVVVANSLPVKTFGLIQHQSLPLAQILRQMNIYSNNKMAQILTDLLGGADEVARYTAEIATVPRSEIQLVNGSGLGEENRLSPRAVALMLIASDRLLQNHDYSIGDLFPVSGRDVVGTIQERAIPAGTVVKTGTLDRVSSLAGVIPTSDRGQVWFAIINNGSQVEYFRQQQDLLLKDITQNWQLLAHSDIGTSFQSDWYLGDPRRNIKNQVDIPGNTDEQHL